MKYWLMKKLGIIKRRMLAEFEIIERLQNLNLSDDDIDNIVNIVKSALDEQFN